MYDERDLKHIINRAIEIQKRTNGPGDLEGLYESVSLQEIEDIARDSGLSPEYVRQAAIELEGVPIEKPFFLDKGNNYEVELLGFAKGKFDQKTWAELRSIIESEFKSSGTVKRHSDGIIWKTKPTGILNFFKPNKTTSVEVENSGYRSVIRIKKNIKSYNKLLYPAYASLAGSIILFTIMLQNSEPSILLAIAALLGISKLFFSWRDSLKEKSKERLTDTMAKLQTIINRRFTALEQDYTENKNSINLESDTKYSENKTPDRLRDRA